MDKNTIVGFVLIALVVFGFSIWNKPSEEKLAEQKRLNDSIQNVQRQKLQEELKLQDSLKLQAMDEVVNNFTAVDQSQQFVSANNTTEVVSSEADSVEVAETPVEKTEVAEQIVSLENELLKIEFSTKGAQMKSARLKGYTTYAGDSLYLFNKDALLSLELENKSSIKLNTKNAIFTPIVESDSSVLILRHSFAPSQYIDFIYALQPESYMVKFDVVVVGMKDVLSSTSKEKFLFAWQQDLKRKEKSVQNEQNYSHIYYKFLGQDVEELSSKSNVTESINEPVKWIAFKDQFFASVLIADYSFDISELDSKVLSGETYLKKYGANLYTTPVAENDGSFKVGFRYFLGPLQYSMLKSYDDAAQETVDELDLDKLVPLGWTLFRWINQYFVIPIFNVLNKTGLGMGVIILLLTVIVKLIISPLTYKSYMSSAKMRVLRPQVEEINAKYPKQEQAMERQRATMDLYGRAGASPMSGCLPMLLQMPILIALFAFFPSAIELRQHSFLWAEDLSTYDAIIEWGTSIPLLGNHISLFCLLMTITNVVYTKFNMDMTNTGQQQMPGMKWMMMLMPVIFLFILNDYPSGLTYYYFISTLITILLTLSFRYFIDEEKLLAKLEANKKKVKKKSGFMARLEEAQRIQQQQQKKKNNGKGRR
ncbi:membrane protein insertase YidC [Dysgonomonas sp. 216]|uniref:membrane protein insertase YidC n=1 Tax=Dysgonomonas sp. 216 TaxID=2302934 RepID=UPI0013D33F2E|nr:membrane protein insertase YidC [Dysgonomonas sp. 216]NDW18523.1 membrane protein insertase YidC [Dysgonomonas sp. 216]